MSGSKAVTGMGTASVTHHAAIQTATPTFWHWFQRIPGRPGLSNALRCKDGGYVGLLVRPGRFALFLEWLDEAGVEHDMTPGDAHFAEVGAPRRNNPVANRFHPTASRLSSRPLTTQTSP